MLALQHLQFWAAIRKGWGTERWGIWRPSEPFLAEGERMLLEGLHFPHTAWQETYEGPSRNLGANVIGRINDSGIAPQEIARFEELYQEGLGLARIAALFHEWIEADEFVSNSRTTEEHFMSQDLRLDRLERLIREDWLINGHRTLGGELDIQRRGSGRSG
jgi:hypothetical protein